MKQELRTQVIFIVCFLAVWQIVYQMQAFPELIFPSLGEIGRSFVEGFRDDSLMTYTLYSMSLIIKGLFIGIGLAFIFSSLAVVSKIFYAIYNLVVSIMDLLPGVALLPLAIMWFGIGEATIIVIVIRAGMRGGGARPGRGLSSVEMIFGTTGAGAGIGWLIFMKRTNVDIAGVFAALIVIIIIGIIIEYGVFRTVEKKTVKKWGMVK